ncbi:hypothetical protein J6590_045973 [Homalodisca vitripennis]|nr:hypothetical protein J6590_045973 [Homalodisca vitripennis]
MMTSTAQLLHHSVRLGCTIHDCDRRDHKVCKPLPPRFCPPIDSRKEGRNAQALRTSPLVESFLDGAFPPSVYFDPSYSGWDVTL